MSVIGVINHSTPYTYPNSCSQWQFLESLCEDTFVIQLGALHIKDRCRLIIPNLMVALSLHSMTTTLRSHGIHIDYHKFLCFKLMRNAYLVANSCRNPCTPYFKMIIPYFIHFSFNSYHAYTYTHPTSYRFMQFDNKV